MDWQSIGRISEVGNLQVCQLHSDREDLLGINCLKVDWYRDKTSNQHELHVLPAIEPGICGLHSLGCYLMFHTISGDDLFPHDTSYATKINTLLRNIESKYKKSLPPRYTKGLTSHSVRRGTISYLSYFNWINYVWTSIRGGFTPK